MGKAFDPEKYGMVVCPECKGKGKILKDTHDFTVCEKCSGYGFLKKEKEDLDKDRE
jgi:DnaJ-class molecular chaperone